MNSVCQKRANGLYFTLKTKKLMMKSKFIVLLEVYIIAGLYNAYYNVLNNKSNLPKFL